MQADRIDGTNAIARHGPEGVLVNGTEYTTNLLVPWTGDVRPWPVESFDVLSEGDFEQLLAFEPELVVFGSGTRLRFAHPRLMRTLMAERVGIETMDTPAACRTYNVLLSEGRRVVAALLFD